MTIVSNGYNGDFDEVAWSKSQAALGTVPYGVDSNGFNATIVANAASPRVLVEADSRAEGWGVSDYMDVATEAVVVTPPTAAGTFGWDTLVLRRDWTTNTTTLRYVNGNANPLPSTALLANPGVSADQPLWLVQSTAGTTVVTDLLDLRTFPYKPMWTLADDPLPDPAKFGYGQQLLLAKYGHTLVRRGDAGNGTASWFNLDDPPWSNLNIGGGMVAGTSTPQYRVRRGELEMRGNGRRSPATNGGVWTSATTTDVRVGTLPATLAPAQHESMPVSVENGMGGTARGIVTTGGEIYVTLLANDQFGGLYYRPIRYAVKVAY